MSPRIVCAGVLTLDTLALVPAYPAADERMLSEEVRIAGGGPAANAAVVLARHGHEVAFLGCVGADPAGEMAVAMLASEGVDVSCVLTDARRPTQISCVVISPGARAISTQALPPLPALDAFGAGAAQMVRQAEWLHVDHLGFATIAPLLRGLPPEARPRLSIDAGNPVPGLDLSLATLHVPTGRALTTAFDLPDTPAGRTEAARRALEAGAAAVVATQGEGGASAWWSGRFDGTPAGMAHADAPQTVDIRSTLGAGDVFHGALVSALVRGLSFPQALAEANACAALSCRALDGRSAVPGLDELHAFLAAEAGRVPSPSLRSIP